MKSQAENFSTTTDDFGLPDPYQEYAEGDLSGAGSTTDSTQQKQSFAYTTTEARAFLNEVKRLPNSDTYVFKLALMAGKTKDDKPLRLYGDFFPSKRLKRLAAQLEPINFDDAGIVCTVKILNLHAEPEHGDMGRIFENYRGFLVGLSFE